MYFHVLLADRLYLSMDGVDVCHLLSVRSPNHSLFCICTAGICCNVGDARKGESSTSSLQWHTYHLRLTASPVLKYCKVQCTVGATGSFQADALQKCCG